MTDKQWFIDKYDEIVGDEPDEGATVEKSRDAVAHAYADTVEDDPDTRRRLDLVEEGRLLFDREVGSERKRRRASLKQGAEHIRDAIAGDTILGEDDPVLDQAYPLGNGSDKTLGYWTAADWIGAVQERKEGADEAQRSAREFATIAGSIVSAMTERGVTITGRLFGAP